MKYFAYGSNMSTKRLRARITGVCKLGTGVLTKHRLAFHKRGRDGSAKCDAVFTNNTSDAIHGVLFELGHEDKRKLDNIEGLGKGYATKTASIYGENDITHEAFLYIASDIQPGLLPLCWYVTHVVKGAEEAGLPADYIEQLLRVESRTDSNTTRRRYELSIYKK